MPFTITHLVNFQTSFQKVKYLPKYFSLLQKQEITQKMKERNERNIVCILLTNARAQL